MYYSSGNYEAFARPRKPEGVERKSAWLVGSGLASLAAACFLVRDGQMKGENIHILEELKAPRRGLRRHPGPHPGLRDPGRPGDGESLRVPVGPVSLHPIPGAPGEFCFGRILLAEQGGPQLFPVPGHGGSGKGRPYRREVHSERQGRPGDHEAFPHPGRGPVRQDHRPTCSTEEFFRSNFWLYWRTMFAFETWHSALEMKLYLQRFIHHIGGLPDFSRPEIYPVQPV